jgi:hypothetical protein
LYRGRLPLAPKPASPGFSATPTLCGREHSTELRSSEGSPLDAAVSSALDEVLQSKTSILKNDKEVVF